MVLFKRIALGISGGLDSAISALFLKRRGYEVIGLFMRNWDTKDEFGYCATDQDAEDAEKICKQLDIPFYEINFVQEYWNEVFEYFIKEYKHGRTPNPDIYCNSKLKFGNFLTYAQEKFDVQAIATGHYARSSFGTYLEHYHPEKGAKLLQSFDQIKCQTYFLSRIPQLALQKTMFPVGGMTKDTVRKVARENGFGYVADRKESMGICFIGKRHFPNFISQYLRDEPGDFVDLDTHEKVGEHRGLHHWTLGQQARIEGFQWKYFIHSKDAEQNLIYVVRGTKHPALFSHSSYVQSFQWIHEPPDELLSHRQMKCQFRFQNRLPLIDCTVNSIPRHELPPSSSASYVITTKEASRALTPGQFAVIYNREECLGSAVIDQPGPSLYDLNTNNCRSTLMAETQQ